eukprot:ANDGO_07071.mRNA.1 hypothetical protein
MASENESAQLRPGSRNSARAWESMRSKSAAGSYADSRRVESKSQPLQPHEAKSIMLEIDWHSEPRHADITSLIERRNFRRPGAYHPKSTAIDSLFGAASRVPSLGFAPGVLDDLVVQGDSIPDLISQNDDRGSKLSTARSVQPTPIPTSKTMTDRLSSQSSFLQDLNSQFGAATSPKSDKKIENNRDLLNFVRRASITPKNSLDKVGKIIHVDDIQFAQPIIPPRIQHNSLSASWGEDLDLKPKAQTWMSVANARLQKQSARYKAAEKTRSLLKNGRTDTTPGSSHFIELQAPAANSNANANANVPTLDVRRRSSASSLRQASVRGHQSAKRDLHNSIEKEYAYQEPTFEQKLRNLKNPLSNMEASLSPQKLKEAMRKTALFHIPSQEMNKMFTKVMLASGERESSRESAVAAIHASGTKMSLEKTSPTATQRPRSVAGMRSSSTQRPVSSKSVR